MIHVKGLSQCWTRGSCPVNAGSLRLPQQLGPVTSVAPSLPSFLCASSACCPSSLSTPEHGLAVMLFLCPGAWNFGAVEVESGEGHI